jgi:tRNA modification GTPase
MMTILSNNDTIAAIATAIGESGINIVRISGGGALGIADKIFRSRDGLPSSYSTHTVHYGWVVKCSGGGFRRTTRDARRRTHDETLLRIDEVLLTVMRGPRSYTKEDVVEINCHGGAVAARKVLKLALELGARLAEPGEFTRRAFINGRIDLTQAEAVLDVIHAQTEAAFELGLQQLEGNVSCLATRLRGRLLELLMELEANINFPEDAHEEDCTSRFGPVLEEIDRELRRYLQNAEKGRIIKEGIRVVICGSPNVGKSSLLNALLRKERAIVTAIAGTTRDTIEEAVSLRGIPVKLIDTAGLARAEGLLDRHALRRTLESLRHADVTLVVLDGNKKISPKEIALLRKMKHKKCIAVVNKIDLPQRIEKEKLLRYCPLCVEVSARKGTDIELLEDAISGLVLAGEVDIKETLFISNLRHIRIFQDVQKSVAAARKSLDNTLSAEFIAEDLKAAVTRLDLLLGKDSSAELLDKIFSRFCIGK